MNENEQYLNPLNSKPDLVKFLLGGVGLVPTDVLRGAMWFDE